MSATTLPAPPPLPFFENDPFVAVFNCRKAHERAARVAYVEKYGAESFAPLARFLRQRGGIMAVFDYYEVTKYVPAERAWYFICEIAWRADAWHARTPRRKGGAR